MSERKIKVTIDPLGNPTIDALGFQGQGCTDATKLIEETLAYSGNDMTVEMKPEWNETEDQVEVTEVGQGW